MVVRMRHTRSHTRNRRSHHALLAPTLSKDKDNGAVHLRHRASAVSGTYKGMEVKSLQKKLNRNLTRKKEKAKLEVKQS